LLKGLDLLKDGGRIVSLVQPVDGSEFRQPGRRAIYVFVKPNGAELWHLATLMREGKLKPRIAAEFPLAEAAKAHELIEGGHVAGKLVLTL
jgi:NADPH2:quinone reductase